MDGARLWHWHRVCSIYGAERLDTCRRSWDRLLWHDRHWPDNGHAWMACKGGSHRARSHAPSHGPRQRRRRLSDTRDARTDARDTRDARDARHARTGSAGNLNLNCWNWCTDVVGN